MVVFIYHKQLLLTWRCIKWCLRYHTNQHHFMVLCNIKYFMEHFFVSKCQTTTRLMQPAIINNIMNKRVQSFPNHTYVFVNLFPVLFFFVVIPEIKKLAKQFKNFMALSILFRNLKFSSDQMIFISKSPGNIGIENIKMFICF